MDDLWAMWRRRRAGEGVSCGQCGGAVALSVGTSSYRWCCRACGAKSERFRVDRDGGVRAVDIGDPAFAREALLLRALKERLQKKGSGARVASRVAPPVGSDP